MSQDKIEGRNPVTEAIKSGREIDKLLVSAKEGSALGSAIIAAAAAGADRGGYSTVTEAIHAMSAPCETVILPCQAHVPVYQRLFEVYKTLHNHFGMHRNEIMYALKSIRGVR